jgi:hypothetical protein
MQAVLAVRSWWRADRRHRALQRWDALLARCAFARAFGQGAAERLRASRDAAIEGTGTALAVASREAAVQEWVRQNLRTRLVTDRRSFSGYGRAPGYAAGLRSSGSARRAIGSGG